MPDQRRAPNAWLRAQGDAHHPRNASAARKNSGDERYGQVDADRTIVTVQDWLLPVPPQLAVIVEVAWFHEPMQPVPRASQFFPHTSSSPRPREPCFILVRWC